MSRIPALLLHSCAILAALSTPLSAQSFDAKVPPGENYQTAQFRLWHPESVDVLRAIVVLVPGSNGDGRREVEDSAWRELARKHDLALLGVYLTDKRHPQMFIEEYVDVARGSGAALLEAVDRFASESGHPELNRGPLLLWGMSAGGQFNYEFALWKPERVLAFVVNKGGIYYSAQASEAAQQVPGFFFIGEEDIEFRNDIIQGIFSINRRAGALWALAVEPGVSHEVAGSKDMAIQFFDELIPMRLPNRPSDDGSYPGLRPLERGEGYIADPRSRDIQPAPGAPETTYPTSWLPTKTLAQAWQRLVSGWEE